jgi:hypothetical protein
MHVNMNFVYLFYDFLMDAIDMGFSNHPHVEKFMEQSIEILPVNNNSRTTTEFKIENPQLIFYENLANVKLSNSLIVNQKEIFITFETIERVQNIDISFIECLIKLKIFKTDTTKNKPVKYLILSPTSLFFNGSIKNNEEFQTKTESFKVSLPEINVIMTQLVFSSFLDMIKSINQSFYQNQVVEKKVVQVKEEDDRRIVKYQSLFRPMPFKSDDFWFTKPNDLVKESDLDETLPSISMQDKINQNTKTELKIKASRINFQLESDQVPLIRLHLAINEGSIKNWLIQPSLHLVICLEMAYFNQIKVVWEPVIEQIEDSNSELKLYEFSVDMITNSHNLEQIALNEVASNSKNFPIRTFTISSSHNLQFVITRTFFNLIDTITNNFDIFYGEKNAFVEEGNDEWNLIKMIENEKNLENELDEQQTNVQDSDSDEEDDHVKATSASFKNLIKNELGFDVSLESVSGFKVRVF